MKDIHIIGGKYILDNYFNNLERILDVFNVSYNGEKNFNFIFHREITAYDFENDFQANAFIEHDLGTEEYNQAYHDLYKFMNNDDNYDFSKSHQVFFNIISKFRNKRYTQYQKIDKNDFVILLTEVRGDDNWLSATDESNNCYIHMQDWQYLIEQAELSYIPNIFELCVINSIFQNLYHSLIT